MSPSEASTFRIPRDGTLRFKSAHALTLHCTDGLLWLTAEGFGGDIFLRRGMAVTAHGAKNLLLTAERESTIDIHALHMTAPPWNEAPGAVAAIFAFFRALARRRPAALTVHAR